MLEGFGKLKIHASQVGAEGGADMLTVDAEYRAQPQFALIIFKMPEVGIGWDAGGIRQVSILIYLRICGAEMVVRMKQAIVEDIFPVAVLAGERA